MLNHRKILPVKILPVVVLLLAIAGCQSAGAPGTPAVLAPVDEKPKTHPLADTISYLLNGAKVTLADDAFYNSSEVIIEGPLLGRTFEKPHRFRLWLVNGICVLEHVESKKRLEIFGMRCQARQP